MELAGNNIPKNMVTTFPVTEGRSLAFRESEKGEREIKREPALIRSCVLRTFLLWNFCDGDLQEQPETDQTDAWTCSLFRHRPFPERRHRIVPFPICTHVFPVGQRLIFQMRRVSVRCFNPTNKLPRSFSGTTSRPRVSSPAARPIFQR